MCVCACKHILYMCMCVCVSCAWVCVCLWIINLTVFHRLASTSTLILPRLIFPSLGTRIGLAANSRERGARQQAAAAAAAVRRQRFRRKSPRVGRWTSIIKSATVSGASELNYVIGRENSRTEPIRIFRPSARLPPPHPFALATRSSGDTLEIRLSGRENERENGGGGRERQRDREERRRENRERERVYRFRGREKMSIYTAPDAGFHGNAVYFGIPRDEDRIRSNGKRAAPPRRRGSCC